MKPVLPPEWQWVRLGEVVDRKRDLINPSDHPDREFNSVGLEDIGSDGTGDISFNVVTGAELASAKAQFEQGDLLYGRLRPYLNKVAIAPCQGVSSTEIWVLSPSPFLDSEFTFWMLTSRYMLRNLERVTEGANLPRVDADGFDRIEIPVPPLSEQRRIVEILNEARDIRRLRQQAEDLTTQLIPAMFNEMFGGLDRSMYLPLARLWAKPPQNGLYKHAEHYGTGTRIVRIGDFYDGIIVDISLLQRLRLTDKESRLYSLSREDILVNRVNSIEYIGKSAIVPPMDEPAVFESNMMRFSIDPSRVQPDFLIAYLQHPLALHELRRRAKQAVNQASINQTDLGALPIPVEVKEIIERVDGSSSGAEAVLRTFCTDGAARYQAETEPEFARWPVFDTLLGWRKARLIDNATLTIKRVTQMQAGDGELDDVVVTWDDLSDGEQMLLGRMSLMLLLSRRDGSLLLLDEPEAHFNDSWKREIIDIVDDNILKTTAAHVIVATHTSIALTDAFASEIIRLIRANGNSVFKPVSFATFGAETGRVMLQVFDTPESIGSRANEALEILLNYAWTKENINLLEHAVTVIGGGWPRAKLREILGELRATPNS